MNEIEKVRLIVSSKYWGKFLKNIPEVTSIIILDGKAHLVTNIGLKSESVSIYPSTDQNIKVEFSQEGCRWESVQRVLSAVEEQPVVLEIKSKVVNVIFQFGSVKP